MGCPKIQIGGHRLVFGELEHDRGLKTTLTTFHWGFTFISLKSYSQILEIQKHFYKKSENKKIPYLRVFEKLPK